MTNLIKLNDEQLLDKILNDNCNDSFKEIVSRHEKLVFDVCSKYAKRTNAFTYQDIIKDSYFIVNEAIRTFRNDRGAKFSTWLGHFTRFYCLKMIKSLHKNTMDVPLQTEELDLLNIKNDKYHKNEYDDITEHINNILLELEDKRIQKIFALKYFNDSKNTAWTEIAKQMKMSAMHTINLHNRGCKLLKSRLKNCI